MPEHLTRITLLRLLTVVGLGFTGTTGCSSGLSGSGGGDLQLSSLTDDPRTLTAAYQTVLYRHDAERGTSFIISDLTAETLAAGDFDDGVVIHLELLWIPKPGATPMDATATNLSIRHVVFSSGEVGIYGGAGFAIPRGEPGEGPMTLSLRDSSLSLLESTDGFVDLMSPAMMTGSVTAAHEPDRTRSLYYSISQRVTDLLGRSRFVRARIGAGDGDRVDWNG